MLSQNDLDALDDHDPYAVALVDKRHARVYVVAHGQIDDLKAVDDEVSSKHDQGGLSQARYQRHHEAEVHWHLKRVVDHLADLHRRRQFLRLILAGPVEATSEFKTLLPHELAATLAETIPAETFASDHEILEKTLEVEHRIEREDEDRLVEDLIEKAGSGGRATLGVAPTLEALWLREVQTLVVASGSHTEGSECLTCGRLENREATVCAACGARLQPVADLSRLAIERTLEQAGSVKIVHDEAAKKLAAGGGFGALLRFVSESAPEVTARRV